MLGSAHVCFQTIVKGFAQFNKTQHLAKAVAEFCPDPSGMMWVKKLIGALLLQNPDWTASVTLKTQTVAELLVLHFIKLDQCDTNSSH